MAERGLPFRGDKETFGSPHNGNFLGLLEPIAKFDPFLASHTTKMGIKDQVSHLIFLKQYVMNLSKLWHIK